MSLLKHAKIYVNIKKARTFSLLMCDLMNAVAGSTPCTSRQLM